MTGLSPSARLGAAVLAGAILALAMAPFHYWPVLLICVPLFLRLQEKVSARMAFALGWAFGFGYFVASLYWIGIAFLVDADQYEWLLPVAVTGLPAYLALFWGAASLGLHYLRERGMGRVLAFAVLFTIAEYLRGHLLTGFPWNAPGYAAFGLEPMAQMASLFGLWGVTFCVLWLAAAPLLLLQRRWLAGCAALMMGLAIWGWGHYRLANEPSADVPGLHVRIVQPNVPQSDKWRTGNAGRMFTDLLSLTDRRTPEAPDGAADMNLFIWPESAVPFLLDEQLGAREAIGRLLPDAGVLLAGSLRREIVGDPGGPDDRIFNSVLALNGTGEVVGRYDKAHLVPWGEYLPLESWLAPLGLRRLVTLPGSFVAGPGPRSLALPGLPTASPLLCYEAIFPAAVVEPDNRPAFLANLTNDGWFGQSTGPHQHFDQARMRAIEEGLPLLRAANTGISGVVDPLGRVRAQTRLGEQAVVDSTLPAPGRPTLYAAWGNYPLGLFVCAWVIFCIFRRKQSAKIEF